MRLNKYWFGVLLIALLLIGLFGAVSAYQGDQEEYSGPKWEYLTFVYSFTDRTGGVLISDTSQLLDINAGLQDIPEGLAGGAEIAHYLDYLGGLGYELVDDVPSPEDSNRLVFFFKRPAQ